MSADGDETTSAEEARSVAEAYVVAWTAGDLGAVLDCYDERFTLHYFGDNPFTGDHVGRDAAMAVLAEVSVRAPRTLVAVDEVLAGPGAAALVVRERLEVGGEAHEVRRVLRYRVAGGRFIECWLYEEDQAIVDRAWA